MSAQCTSGWLGFGQPAWHGIGHVTEGTLPARQAFELAGALFGVEKRELFYNKEVIGYTSTDSTVRYERQNTGAYATVRQDTQQQLGIVSDKYEVVPQDSLLRMAEFLREEADMDSVVVLADGRKTAFTAALKGASADILPGDTVKSRIVGYLGHDGMTSCGALFTNIRVVCSNTLALAMRDAKVKACIHHKQGAIKEFDSLIKSINIARQSFVEQVDIMKELAQYQVPDFTEYVKEVYAVNEISKFRKMTALRRSYIMGMGAGFGRGTLWNAVNAVTEVETSTKQGTHAQRKAKFNRANFGEGMVYSKKALQVAQDLIPALV